MSIPGEHPMSPSVAASCEELVHQFETIDFSGWIPIFPLPNAVLMPRAILPLHVFEHRYRAMTRDVLNSSHVLATALLKPGYEAQ